MATAIIPATLAIPRRSFGEWVNVFALETKYEILKYLRLRIFSISTLVFPIMFYVLFGIVLPSGGANRAQTATYLLATMACYGVMGIAMFSFGVGISVERGQGWLQVKRASPMPLPAYFLAKIVNAMFFATAISLLLLAVGGAFGGVRMPLLMQLKLISVLVLGSIPFSAMGLAIGYFTKPNSAPAVVNLIYLPMSFCSGLWIPIFILPKVLQNIAQVLPPYHVAQLALNAIKAGPNPTSVGVHVEALIGVTLLFLGLAAYGYRKDEGETYG
jgi:ABC-2 type transport system permease protein